MQTTLQQVGLFAKDSICYANHLVVKHYVILPH